MATLSVAYIVRDELSFLPLSLEQAEKIADEIVVVVDDRSNDGTKEYLFKKVHDSLPEQKYKLIVRKWDSGAAQKDFALQQCTKDWILFLDGDEVLTDNCEVIKSVIDKYDSDSEVEAFNLLGHHFIYSLAIEDATTDPHVWEARLFKRLPHIYIAGINHAVLMGFKKQPVNCVELDAVRILHYGYVKGLQKILDKFEEDLKIKQFHKESFLWKWKDWHLLSKMPVKEFKGKHPLNVLKKFHLEYFEDKDYFSTRDKMELKFLLDAHFFIKNFNPKTVLDLGCGMGQRVFALRNMRINALGCDISRFAVTQSPFGIDDFLLQWDVTSGKCPVAEKADLVIAYDLLEHLPMEKLDVALDNIKPTGKTFIFSVCFDTDPNFPLDATHKIKESREWWQERLESKGFKILQVPADLPYAHQIIVCEV